VAIIVVLLLPWVLLRSWTAPLYFVGVSVLVVAVMLIPIQGFREIGSMLFVGLLLDTLVARPPPITPLVALSRNRHASPKRNSAPKRGRFSGTSQARNETRTRDPFLTIRGRRATRTSEETAVLQGTYTPFGRGSLPKDGPITRDMRRLSSCFATPSIRVAIGGFPPHPSSHR
jgi:hypothetical protein